MTNPVPGAHISTPFGIRGPYWSCFEDESGNGLHTGADYAASQGSAVVAARPGKVVHVSHGAAFGRHQIEIRPGDGTRDFYAHMSSRIADGTEVKMGQKVGTVGREGNVTGPHLHFERHRVAVGPWSCYYVVDPAKSINYEEDEMNGEDWIKLREIVREESARTAAANNPAAADAVWDKKIEVTKPDGDKVEKSTKQVLRETWQRISKMS